ncbi:MAG: AraC family transcriptional regulator [Kiloniellales bacterium]|nr:AraC family transcriptional regulator [Kiloniellales bacterium]
MGKHAFEQESEICRHDRSDRAAALPRIYGVEARWNMPVSRHRRPITERQGMPGVDHYVLIYYLGGAPVRRLDEAKVWGVAQRGDLSLETPGSRGTYASNGTVEYAELHFRQNLMCEIADEVGLGSVAEPEDFFGLRDRDWARDVETYIARAGDCSDPPGPMEMDSRAYLIGLGVLRTLRDVSAKLDVLHDRVTRADLRPVLGVIEEKLSETIRLSDLSAHLGMSPFHFARVFKAEMGEAPAQYLMRRRTERAIELIAGTGLNLATIAYRSGFSSQSHMHRRIKQATGKTPGALRADTTTP